MNVERLVYQRTHPLRGRWARAMLRLHGIDIPPEVPIGESLVIQHQGFGLVVGKFTAIGARVTLFHNVTIGRRDAELVNLYDSEFERVDVSDDTILFPGSVVLGGRGRTILAEGTVLGANSVLTCSTGPWEIWAGAPAKKIADRESGKLAISQARRAKGGVSQADLATHRVASHESARGT